MPVETILIVDDDPICAAVASLALRQAGFTTQSATGGRQALEILKTLQPALILSDIQMPEMDGFELARRARQIPWLRDIPMVALTAFTGQATEQRAYEAGFTDFMTKPANAAALALCIRRLLERPFAPCA